MKLLICILSLFTLTAPSAFAGKLKGKIAQTSDNRMESQIFPVNKKEVRAFYNTARLNPTASLFVSIDIDNDGKPESYVFRPGKDDDCDFTGRDNDCEGLVTSDVDVKSIAETLVNRIRDPQSGLPSGRRMQVITSESQTSISAYNGAISISKVEELIVDKKYQYVVEYETFTINFKKPSFDFTEYLRKGWDGSIKGVSSSSVQKRARPQAPIAPGRPGERPEAQPQVCAARQGKSTLAPMHPAHPGSPLRCPGSQERRTAETSYLI